MEALGSTVGRLPVCLRRKSSMAGREDGLNAHLYLIYVLGLNLKIARIFLGSWDFALKDPIS